MKKVEKHNYPNKMNLFCCKANVTRFGFDNLHQDSDIMGIIPKAINTRVISISIHLCVNNSHDIKVLKKVIKTETFNVCFTSK